MSVNGQPINNVRGSPVWHYQQQVDGEKSAVKLLLNSTHGMATSLDGQRERHTCSTADRFRFQRRAPYSDVAAEPGATDLRLHRLNGQPFRKDGHRAQAARISGTFPRREPQIVTLVDFGQRNDSSVITQHSSFGSLTSISSSTALTTRLLASALRFADPSCL